MRGGRRARRRQEEAAELNITAFMNLMVILVPFLLITAVFSRMAIIELNLPASSSEPVENPEETLQLEITVRADSIEVGDRRGVLLSKIDNTEEGYNFDRLAEKLVEIKEKNPDKIDATLLLEPNIEYDVVVQVMDRMRVEVTREENEISRRELFPVISVGDAIALPAGDPS